MKPPDDWRSRIDVRRTAWAVGLLAFFVVFTVASSILAPSPKRLLAETSPRCANKKLPSYFVSDPRLVRAAGGKPSLYVEGASDDFGIGPIAVTPSPAANGDGSSPDGVRPSPAKSGGGAYGSGTMGMTTIERPDAGTLLLAVANDEADREMGLMCVTKMAPRVGMIFVFGADSLQNFWMKNTLIPLDMIFVTGAGKVTTVAANVPSSRIDQPDATLARRAGLGRYVLELNAGEAEKDHIVRGSVLAIPKLTARD